MTTTVDLSYLIPAFRLHIGDRDEERYTDEWLYTALVASVSTLQTWWNYRYLIDSDNDAYRNSRVRFLHSSPPVIQNSDERPIILMASIIVKRGELENMSWNLGHWRDAEISYSNIEGGRTKRESLKQDWDELTSMLKPPQKSLAESQKGHLPGYLENPMERAD